MNEGLVHLHNFLRWVILVLLVLSIVKSYSGWKGKKAFSPADARVWLFTMLTAHITLLLGLYQWLAGRYGMLTSELPAGTSMMKDKFYRFFWMEHPLTMILAIVMITLGRGMAKKTLPDEVKYRKAFWFFFIALVLIFIGMPWPFRELIGRPWFPGMG
jgi:uncharacterized membrane protein AbrB (regulator of aidB expression)